MDALKRSFIYLWIYAYVYVLVVGTVDIRHRSNSHASLTDPLVLYGWLICKFPWQGFSSFFANFFAKNEVKPCHGNLWMSHP